MKVIALYNLKGGVGKTTTAVHLAYLSASQFYTTLLVDLDPQGAASYFFKVDLYADSKVKKILKKPGLASQLVKGTDYENLDILPASFSLRTLDLKLDQLKNKKKFLKLLFHYFKNEYDVIIIDCADNIGLEGENIFQASDLILLPLIPTPLCFLTYQKMMQFFKAKKIKKHCIKAFFSMVDSRKKMHSEMIHKMLNESKHFLDIQIPYSSLVEKTALSRVPLAKNQARTRPGLAYNKLWQAVKNEAAIL